METLTKDAPFVGQGLEEQTQADALAKHLNPNANGVGAFRSDLSDTSFMADWIKQDQAGVLKTIRSSE